jgi:hypothetical protein
MPIVYLVNLVSWNIESRRGIDATVDIFVIITTENVSWIDDRSHATTMTRNKPSEATKFVKAHRASFSLYLNRWEKISQHCNQSPRWRNTTLQQNQFQELKVSCRSWSCHTRLYLAFEGWIPHNLPFPTAQAQAHSIPAPSISGWHFGEVLV